MTKKSASMADDAAGELYCPFCGAGGPEDHGSDDTCPEPAGQTFQRTYELKQERSLSKNEILRAGGGFLSSIARYERDPFMAFAFGFAGGLMLIDHTCSYVPAFMGCKAGSRCGEEV